MKSKKVLLGLFVGLFALATGSAMAQTQANSLIEVGPDNIGGRVRSVLVDQSDSTLQTIYAGAVAGGLYYRDADHTEWQIVPCTINGKSVVLPITAMVQGSDNTIYIATGEGCYPNGFNSSAFAPLGRGLVSFNPATGEFTQLIAAPTTPNDEFAVMNKLALISHNGHDYLYIATAKGLYRWDVNHDANPTKITSGTNPVEDVELVEYRNVAYFTSGNHLYKQSDIWNNGNITDISATNPAFGGENTKIELAVSPSDPSYLYAMVFDKDRLLEGLYLTKDQQNWTLLNTTTIRPFLTNTGATCGALTVDPGNPDRVFMAGSVIYAGEGFVENSFYQWAQSSLCEQQLNGGNYMSDVFSNSAFVHGGIHQILPVWRNGQNYYYIATDGGVFMTYNNFATFVNINRGLNISQIVGLDVCPDGSLISGVLNNADVFIEARLNHHGGDTNHTWYDSVSTMNHLGNVIFQGTGGQVAASMFQQVEPQNRRCVFVSSNSGYGRSNKDYSDFTNTQAWTYGSEFVGGDLSVTSNPGMALYETVNGTNKNDSLTFTLDLFSSNNPDVKTGAIVERDNVLDTIEVGDTTDLGVIVSIDANSITTLYRTGTDEVTRTITVGSTTNNGVLDNITMMGSDRAVIRRNNFTDTIAIGSRILAGDRVLVLSRAHSYYPFTYTFQSDVAVAENLKITAYNPLQSRLALVGKDSRSHSAIYVNWYPADFSKVNNESASNSTKMWWAPVFYLDNDSTTYHLAAWSNDGEHLFATIDDEANKKSYIVRATGFNDSIDYSETFKNISSMMELKSGYGQSTTLVYDTVAAFDRLITSIYVNPQAGADNMLVTFGGFDDSHDNVVLLNNISSCTKATQATNALGRSTSERVAPVYSGMIAINSEKNAAKVFVGTEAGAYVADYGVVNGASFSSNFSWNEFGEFNGVPVTAMCQQKTEQPLYRYTQHTGFNSEDYLFGRTKYSYAMYFGTYGRGIFMDSTFVVNHENEIVDSADYVDIPVVYTNSLNSVRVYPNPAVSHTNIEITVANAGNAVVKVYDLSGKMVMSENLGRLTAGTYTNRLNCQGLRNGMYLVNVTVGKQTATTKLIVR